MSGPVGLLVVFLLIAGNGLFVASEFSLVSLRRHQAEERASQGDRRAGLVVKDLSDLSFALSSAQFGITATSLLLGYVAEAALGDAVIRPLLTLVGIPEEAALSVALTLAFALSTITQMIVGELFPQLLAISRPLPVARAVTPFTRSFGIVLKPIIRVFDAAAEGITERVFRVEVRDELEGGHSLDELARIIAASSADGALSEDLAELLRRAAELGDRRVGEVMIPRPDVVWLDSDATLATLQALARSTGHSRFPIRGASEDEVLGSVHVKDLLRVAGTDYATTTVSDVMVPMLAVPESEPLRRLLADLRRQQRTSALVVDEYGGTAGIVTLEDVLEELVGEIHDEFDPRSHEVRRVGMGRHIVRGNLRVTRFPEIFGEALPEGEYETVAGFVLDRLGHIPETGESVTTGNLEITVTKVLGVRVTEVAVRQTEPVTPDDDSHASEQPS